MELMTVRGGIGGEEGIKTREIARFFKIFKHSQEKKSVFWHCTGNNTDIYTVYNESSLIFKKKNLTTKCTG